VEGIRCAVCSRTMQRMRLVDEHGDGVYDTMLFANWPGLFTLCGAGGGDGKAGSGSSIMRVGVLHTERTWSELSASIASTSLRATRYG
jgi:hypothetical protein